MNLIEGLFYVHIELKTEQNTLKNEKKTLILDNH